MTLNEGCNSHINIYSGNKEAIVSKISNEIFIFIFFGV